VERGNLQVPKGYIISIEGIDAVGKNTHSLLLSKWLKKRGFKTARMSFPDYGTPIGKEIKSFLSGRRAYPIELQHMLFAANRWEKFEEIRSYLDAGYIVVVNRYTESNLVYGEANGLALDWIASLEKGLPTANLVIVLDAQPQSLRSRRPMSAKDTFEKSSVLQSNAQKTYKELALKKGWKPVDASGSIGDVQAAVLVAVKEGLARDRGIVV
jgi:dTMP kinase